MPEIKPVSDLRNYTDVLKEVDLHNRVYLTRNGRGAYAIMTIEEANALDRLKAANAIVSDLRRADLRADQQGWLEDRDLKSK